MATRLNAEYELQAQIVEYLNLKYPKLLFRCDNAAMFKATPQQRGRLMRLSPRSGFKMPDLSIFERGCIDGNSYNALFIELKAVTPFRLDGKLKASEHLKEQADSLTGLQQRGFYALFVWSFEQARGIIDEYLKCK